MASIRQSSSTKCNSKFVDALPTPKKAAAPKRRLARGAKKDSAKGGNIEWLQQQAAKAKGKTCLILLGGARPAHVRLRAAQAMIRHDMTPSHWSHVVLCTDATFAEGREIAVAPPLFWKFPPISNGVINVQLAGSDYDKPEEFPNVALITVPIDPASLEKAVDEFKRARRSGLDAVEMMWRWLGYLWGVEGARNPLDEGIGIPSAAMVDFLFSAASYDLTPALNSRSSCPEAIWQSARWWNDYHRDQSKSEGLTGSFLIRHKIVPE